MWAGPGVSLLRNAYGKRDGTSPGRLSYKDCGFHLEWALSCSLAVRCELYREMYCGEPTWQGISSEELSPADSHGGELGSDSPLVQPSDETVVPTDTSPVHRELS